MKQKGWTLLTATALAVLAILGVNGQTGREALAREKSSAVRVHAMYDIMFDGMSIGEFSLASSMTAREYQMNASANISLLAGILFSWKGKTSSRGLVTAGGPQPANYTFAYSTSDKHERINLAFTNNSVTRVAFNPPYFASSRRVPITVDHLRNVVDPLSAVVLLAHVHPQKQRAEACSKTLPIFDGKMRYDLIFSYKGTKRLKEGHYKGPVYVCRVKYVQIAGHKPDKKGKELDAAAENTEVWMLPVADADLVVPYYISVPTNMGRASMKLTKFDVTLPSRGRRSILD
jgi:hypothetical protein